MGFPIARHEKEKPNVDHQKIRSTKPSEVNRSGAVKNLPWFSSMAHLPSGYD
jgi:hypothetical protein